MKTLTRSLILALTLATSPMALAEKMSSETQNLVIDRLEQIIANMEKGDNSWDPSNIRLADLLSERARLRFMNEVEEGCKGCKGSEADRKKALSLYGLTLNSTKNEQKGIILFQMAHLHEIGNETSKAISIYENILKTKSGTYSQSLNTRTRVALADLYFQKGQSKEAKRLYEIALNDPAVPQKGFATYRLAWCEYNLSNFSRANQLLETVAGTDALLMNQTPNGPVKDLGFLSDVLHDLVGFYVQNQVTEQQINKFMSLVPQENKKEMTLLFAQEAGRLGQKQASAKLYTIYLQDKTLSKEERLSASFQLVQTTFDQGHSREAVAAFAATAAAYQKDSCSDETKCKALQKDMRRFVTDLHKLKISKLDQDVLKSYEIYSQTFPKDIEMGILGAQVATDLKLFARASQLYGTAAENAEAGKLRETALLGEIETAEQSNSQAIRETAYLHYLKLMPQGSKSYEIRYQLAQLSYERKQWSKAADQFKSLALEKTTQSDLKKKSADLTLDSLAIEKRDADIESVAQTFANEFPKHASEFRAIYRKAVNAQVVKVANDAKASSGEINAAIKKNQTANLLGASDSERIMHFNNLSVLAKRAHDDNVLMASYASLLTVKSLSADDREATLASQVGFYEKKLDFKSAYQIAQKMKFAKLSTSEKELKLGTLADLASLKPQKHYNKALATGLRGTTEMSVRQRLVLLSGTPVNELKKQSKKMMSNPRLLAETTLLVYAKNKSTRDLGFVLNNPKLKNQSAIRFINKQYFYPQHTKLDQKVSAHKLDLKNDARMAQSIQARLKLLTSVDKSLNEALTLKDFTAQIMVLTTLERENTRLNQELMATPAPKGLTPKELTRYTAMLKKSADPYLAKARLAQNKIQALWSQKSEWQNILRDYAKSRTEVQSLIATEIQLLASLAPTKEIRSLMEDTLDESRLSRKDLISARDSVSENPEDTKQIEKLINLETKLGHPLMTSYLEQRLGQIQKGKSL